MVTTTVPATVSAPVKTAPRFVAKIAIVIARDGDQRVLDRMDQHLEAIEIRGDSLRDLQIHAQRYACDAVSSIGDPGHGTVGVAIDAAYNTGIELSKAGDGELKTDS
jgi:hypothetical protein